MVFDVEITDLFGNVLATPTQYSGLQVVMPVGDDRKGRITLSNYDPAVEQLVFTAHGHRIAALGRMCRIKYRGTTLLWGIIHQPKYSTDKKGVELNIVGPSFKLMHRQLNYSDNIVSPDGGPVIQNPSDWKTMREIVEAAYDTTDQANANIPDIGILVVNVSGADAPGSFWTQIERGSNNWDKLLDVAKSAYGGEFEIVPFNPAGGDIPFNAAVTTVNVDGAFTFPNSPIGVGQTAATITIVSGGLSLPASGKLSAGIIDGTGIHRRYTLTYTGRTATTITGVKGYPALGDFNNLDPITTFGGTKPYHYADLKIYDQLGLNRTGVDLAEDPDNPGNYFDPYTGTQQLHLLYDDQDSDNSTCKGFDWEPDGENCRNQMVGLVSSNDEAKRGIRKIARNINSWLEIGVYSGWDSISGQNVTDVSDDNLSGHVANEVERYGRAPSFFKVTLKTEPASGTPTFGNVGWQPQFLRDFYTGDRVKARGRQGYMDSGDIVGRIMQVTINQLDADNNVSVELDCVPHSTDASEISVV